MTEEKLASYRSFFEYLYSFYNKQEFLFSDPLEFYYQIKGNKEYCAFISSVFAYGKVNLIKNFLTSFFDYYGTKPVQITISTNLYYRFQSSNDIEIFVQFLSEIYQKHQSIENYFYFLSEDLEIALERFIQSAHDFGKNNGVGKGYYFLFPDPKKSAVKRMRMFLRWMIRDDELDTGIWKKYSPSELFYPLDTHIIRFAQNNDIISSKTNSYSNMLKVNSFFEKINSDDPVKYDFSISRLGIIIGCEYKKNNKCKGCIHLEKCPF
jgi:uncharacterized protein (TIGR02757 family)